MAAAAATLGVPGDLASGTDAGSKRRAAYHRAGGAGLLLPSSAAAALAQRGAGELARCRACGAPTCVPVAQVDAGAAARGGGGPCLLLALSCVHARCNRTALGWRALRIQRGAPDESREGGGPASPAARAPAPAAWAGDGASGDPFSPGDWLSDEPDAGLDGIEEDLALAFASGASCGARPPPGRRRKGGDAEGEGPDEGAVVVPVAGEGGDPLPPLPCFYIVPRDEPAAAKGRPATSREAEDAAPAPAAGAADGPGESWAGEEYERSENEHFEKFMKRVGRVPEQCLRYCAPDSRPLRILWPDAAGAEGDGGGARCARCGGALAGEMQIMPQYQHYMLESIEWSREPAGEEEGGGDALGRLEAEVLRWEWSSVAVLGCRRCHGDNYNRGDAREPEPPPGDWLIAELDVVVVGEA